MKRKIAILMSIAILIIISVVVINKNRVSKIDRIIATDSYSYLSNAAKEYIKQVYKETKEVVLTEKNKEENVPYLNPKYVDYLNLSEKEKQSISLIPDVYILDYNINDSYRQNTYPRAYDLRNVGEKNYVSPIKDQGSLGICWAFASIENVETLLMQQNAHSYDDLVPKFSIRQMDYATSTNFLVRDASWISCSGNCSWNPWYNTDNGSRKLGEGGNFFISSIVMANALTLTDESILPWTENNDPKWPKDIMGYDKSLYEVNSTISMPMINANHATNELTDSFVNEVKKYIIQYGGPYVGTYSPTSTCGFENVDGAKAMKTDDCVNHSSTQNQGHAMQIIGWDDDYEYSYCDAGTRHYSLKNGNCTSGELTQGKGAWIVRNSWGDASEEANAYKYVYLTYDSTRLSIGFTRDASKMDERTWNNNYHSNPWINSNVSNGMASVKSQTKDFNTHNNRPEKIEKIKFMTASKNGKYALSISTGEQEFNNVVTIDSDEVGIYTLDLSDKNIIINGNTFTINLVGENDSWFFNDSISVFTSNIDENSYAVTYSEKAYDATLPLSSENPLYANVYYNEFSQNYLVNFSISSYLKNVSGFPNLSYRVRKGSTVANSMGGDVNTHYEGDIATASFDISSNSYSSYFSLKEEVGETWIMEVVANNQVLNSFPVKFYYTSQKTKSNVRLHANNGTDYYYDYDATDKEINKFRDLNGNEGFFNNSYYITSWNTESDGSGISYDADEGVLVYHDMELYAQWSNEKLSAEVVYNSQEGYCPNCVSGTMSPEYYGYDDYIELPISQYTRNGYVFNQWKIKASNTISYLYYEQERVGPKISTILNKPVFNNTQIMVYATWISNYITLSFDANGGSGDMTSINIEPYKDAIVGGEHTNVAISNKIKKNMFTKDGYVFAGWNTEPDGSGVAYTDGQYVIFDQSQTLYAQWTFTYTLNYIVNDIITNTKTISHDEYINLMNAVSKTGYIFKEWNTKKDGTGISYSPGISVKNLANTKDEIVNLYAIYIPITYTITYNPNGAVGETTSEVVTYDENHMLIDNTFTYEGYTFVGWNTAPDGSGTTYTNQQSVLNLTNENNAIITLYAIWEEGEPYTIEKYNYDDAKNYISNVDVNTTVESFISNIKLTNGYTVDVDYKTIDGENVLYTGGKTRIYKNSIPYIEMANIVSGDTNGDAKINYLDYVNVYNHIQKVKHPEINKKLLTDEYLLAADMSKDNKVSYLDYVKIYNKIKELKGGTN